MSNLPLGVEHDPRAPWNEKPIETEEIEVEVILVVSRNVTLKVPIGADNMEIGSAVENYVYHTYDDKDWIRDDTDWNKV